jgi:hypothetical protein
VLPRPWLRLDHQAILDDTHARRPLRKLQDPLPLALGRYLPGQDDREGALAGGDLDADPTHLGADPPLKLLLERPPRLTTIGAIRWDDDAQGILDDQIIPAENWSRWTGPPRPGGLGPRLGRSLHTLTDQIDISWDSTRRCMLAHPRARARVSRH